MRLDLQRRIINIALEDIRLQERIIRDANRETSREVNSLAKTEDEINEENDADVETRDTDADGRIRREEVNGEGLARADRYPQGRIGLHP